MVSMTTPIVMSALDSWVGDGDLGEAGERGRGESSNVVCGWSELSWRILLDTPSQKGLQKIALH